MVVRITLLYTTLCDKVCQWWFSPVSSTNETDCHDITEILLKVALSTINQTNKTMYGMMIYYVHLILFTGILTAISVIIFGAKSATDNHWIESPEKIIVSWSFYCVVFSGFLILFAGVFIIVAGLHAKLVDDYDRRPARYAPSHESRH